jgi:hypothetical protein
MSRAGLRHPWRFALVALALGPVFAWTIARATELLPWMRSPPEFRLLLVAPGDGFGEIGLSFSLTAFTVAWLLRRRIAQVARTGTIALAAGAAWLGGPFFMFFLLLAAAPDEVPRELAEEGWGVLLWIPMALTSGLLLGAVFAPLLLPATLPLAWLSVLLLRWASGGLVDGPGSSHRRARHARALQGN